MQIRTLTVAERVIRIEGDGLVQVGAGAQFAGLGGDERGLAFEDEEDGADAGVEAAALAVVLLLGVAALRRGRLESLLRRAHGLHRVAHFAFDRLLERLPPPFNLGRRDLGPREVGARDVVRRIEPYRLFERLSGRVKLPLRREYDAEQVSCLGIVGRERHERARFLLGFRDLAHLEQQPDDHPARRQRARLDLQRPA